MTMTDWQAVRLTHLSTLQRILVDRPQLNRLITDQHQLASVGRVEEYLLPSGHVVPGDSATIRPLQPLVVREAGSEIIQANCQQFSALERGTVEPGPVQGGRLAEDAVIEKKNKM